MVKTKEILLGLVVGIVAYYMYVFCIGFVVAYLPADFQKITEGMTKEKGVLMLKARIVLEEFLAALPMAITAFVFMQVTKLKASKFFVVMSVLTFMVSSMTLFFETFENLLNTFFMVGVIIPSVLLWLALGLSNRTNKKRQLM